MFKEKSWKDELDKYLLNITVRHIQSLNAHIQNYVFIKNQNWHSTIPKKATEKPSQNTY